MTVSPPRPGRVVSLVPPPSHPVAPPEEKNTGVAAPFADGVEFEPPAAQIPLPSTYAAVRAWVEQVSPEEMTTWDLREQTQGEKLRGAQPKFIAESHGQRFMVKLEHAVSSLNNESDEGAVLLRRSVGEPAVMGVVRNVTRADGSICEARVTHMIPGAVPVPISPRAWTNSEKAVFLADHAWFRWLRNWDGKVDQYLRVQPEGLDEPTALNVDLDHCLQTYINGSTFGQEPLSRYEGQFLPPVQNRLWLAYVTDEFKHPSGKIDELDFQPLFDAITRIESISDETIREATRSLNERATITLTPEERAQKHDALVNMLARARDDLRQEFTTFVGQMEAERLKRRQRQGTLPSPSELKTRWKDAQVRKRHKLVMAPALKHLSTIKSKLPFL